MGQFVEGAVIVIDWVTVLVQPFESLTVRETLYVPAVAQAWEGFCRPEVALSPKFQSQLTTGAPEPASGTSAPAHAVAGRINSPPGGGETLTPFVIETM